jgi:hypothetical protein
MKLILITSIKEDLQAVTHIMEQAGISVFSVSPIVGHKTEHHNYLINNWFFGKNDSATDALVFFSFTSDEAAQKALALTRAYNIEVPSNFPVRAFLLPVEDSSL